ncbi:MAG: hypothetical protein J1E60_06300 [Christensenellaceae bacterium]|nr:hypothetical protein [Christensenellaceae bacterium]
MTLYVKTDKIRLWFPVPLFTLRLLPLIPGGLSSETEFDIKETSLELYRALRQARRDFRGLELVHVRSADGEEVIIKL